MSTIFSRAWPLLVLGAIGLGSTATLRAGADFSESFDDVGPTSGDGPQNLIDQGWTFRNQSQPAGTTVWRQGTAFAFPYFTPHAGSGYLSNYSSWDDGNRNVSTWAILPALPGQAAGDQISFYAAAAVTGNSRIQIRYSPTGGTGTGSSYTDVGDFTEVLGEIVGPPASEIGDWALLSGEIPGTGRLAIRWFEPTLPSLVSPFIGLDTLVVGPPPCNLPPIPAAGETMTWSTAGSPYDICADLVIPAGATVIVEAGVSVSADPGFGLTVHGTMQLNGTAGAPVIFSAPAVWPPMLDVNNGTLDATFAEFTGQVLEQNGSTVLLADCTFIGPFGLFRTQELGTPLPFVQLDRCSFESTGAGLVDCLYIVRDCTFDGGSLAILRGHGDVTAPNTVVNGGQLSITREHEIQPFYLDRVTVDGSAAAALYLESGDYLVGPNTVLQNSLYPLELHGGVLPGSAIPTTGNTNNVINVGDAGFPGWGHWSNLGLTYRATAPHTLLPGGNLTVAPGVTVEFDYPGAGLSMISTRRMVLKGLPGAPIALQARYPGNAWDGLYYSTNGAVGPRLEYCTVRDAEFGVSSTDTWLYVDNCVLMQNQVGANANTYGVVDFGKTQVVNNLVGASVTDLGWHFFDNALDPNTIAGNGTGILLLEPGADSDAAYVWWGDPTGPQHPLNPGGQGDSVTGPDASAVSIFPYLTAPPTSNHPPVVRLTEPGYNFTMTGRTPDYMLETDSKYVLRWTANDDDEIVSQRIEFTPDGAYPDRFALVVDGLPGDARSYEWAVPDPGFAVTNGPQFVMVVATDSNGQEGWDFSPLLVPSGRVTGDIVITTDLSGQTFYGGQPIPDMSWTGSASPFPTITPYIVYESDGAMVAGFALGGGHGTFFGTFPFISTDRARLAVVARNNSNDVKWFFADGYFSVRHDPRLGLAPPAVAVTSPAPGASFAGGTTIPVAWTSSDDAGFWGFDIQASFDGGRSFHVMVADLPADARDYAWRLPPSTGVDDVRIRVIARDIRFQNTSDEVQISIAAGEGFASGDLNCDGAINAFDIDPFVLALTSPEEYVTTYPACDIMLADVNGDGTVNAFDIDPFVLLLTGS